MKPPRRKIVSRQEYTTPNHPRGSFSVAVVLSCGHDKHYKGSNCPKYHATCFDCFMDSNRKGNDMERTKIHVSKSIGRTMCGRRMEDRDVRPDEAVRIMDASDEHKICSQCASSVRKMMRKQAGASR